jgi:predicted metal-dependent phosphotriesterase family hydrolase
MRPEGGTLRDEPGTDRARPGQPRRAGADRHARAHWIDPAVVPFLAQWHYLHIGEEVLPYIRDHGVTGDEITTMLVANPRRFFETAASR